MKKRLLSSLLALCLVMTMVPVAFATGEDNPAPENGAESSDAQVVAQIGDQDYADLASAITAAEDGQTVKMLSDTMVTDEIDFSDKIITLDLNGKTITGQFSDYYSVIEAKGSAAKLIIADTSENETGKIQSNHYGLSASEGGNITVNGGTVIGGDSAALSGNNTAGDMNFTVNGGTLTAEQGPAIYQSGQCNLTITDGTLNGGISLRMGQVNISGGTINATTGSIDSPAEYYNYSGNAWLPDALYVFGGTYDQGNEDDGNSLHLNITGGTFNCANGQGSAVAIYDLGKVAQTAEINISDGTFTTNAKNRGAYDVLSLSDIGVTNPKTGYGTYSGQVSSSITGGTFSSDPSAYVADGYAAVEKYRNEWHIAEAVAQVGDHYYAKTSDATNAAKNGDTIKLLKDVDMSGTFMVNGKTLTLDMNGHKLYNTVDLWSTGIVTRYSLISVIGGGDLTITGNGTVQAKENDCYAADVQGGSTLTIENGIFVGNIHAVYVQEGTANIKGGTYSVQKKYQEAGKEDEFVLNLLDENRKNGTAKMIVTGGTFKNFDPANCWAEGEGTNFVADGYFTEKSGDTYKVKLASDAVAQVGDKKYSSLEKAVQATLAGDTVKLLNDITVSSVDTRMWRTVISKPITLDLNGKTIFGPDDMGNNSDNFAVLYISADTTIVDSVGGGGINAQTNGGYGINVMNGATLTINAGEYYGGGTTVQVQKGSAVINGGTFACEPFGGEYGYNFMLNCVDAAYKDGTAKISVTGGTFKNFDPANCKAEGEGTNFVAEGYGCYQGTVDKLYHVGVKQAVAAPENTIKVTENGTTTDASVSDNGIAKDTVNAINANTAVTNFAGTNADKLSNADKGSNGQSISDIVKEKVGGDITDAVISKTVKVVPTKISAKTSEGENKVVTQVSYDVKPIASVTVGDQTYTVTIPNENISTPLTFRLPVPFEAETVSVLHEGKEVGTYNVLGETGKRYVELKSQSFSEWTVVNASDYEDDSIVAKTTSRSYTNLAEALKDAQNGETVTVLKDCTLDQQVVISDGRDIVLDLGGHTVTSSVTAESKVARPFMLRHGKLTVKNGEINAANGPDTVFAVYGASTDQGADYAVLTLDGTTVLNKSSYYTVAVLPNNNCGYGAVVNIRNGSKLTAKSNLYINGVIQNTTGNYPKFTVEDSKLTSDLIAIYAAGFADWTIQNSTITGATGIYAKAGAFDITGSTIKGNGEYAAPAPNGNGADSTGDAIIMDSKNGYAGHMTMKLTDNTVSSENGYAVHEALTDSTTSTTQTIAISGGTYTAATGKETVKTTEAFDRSDDTNLTVSGSVTGVTEQEKIGQFTAFSMDYGDGVKYGDFSAFLNKNGATIADAINFAEQKAGQKLVANFKVTMGTVSYKTGTMTEFKTIHSGDALENYANKEPITFQIECGNGVTNTFTMTPEWTSVAQNYTLTVKPNSDNVNFVKDGTVTYDVVVSGDTMAIGAYDFTLEYPDEYLTYESYSVADAQVKSTAGELKIAATDDTGITPTEAGTLLGTITFKVKEAYIAGKDVATLSIRDDAVVTPKGYDKNDGTITTAAHKQYYINFKYVGCTNDNYGQWFANGAKVTAKAPVPKTGWSEGIWDKEFVSGTTTAAGAETYTYTATHDVYTVSWDANTPMSVKKADGTTVENGGKVFYEDALTVTVPEPGANKVIRDGDFRYTLAGETGGNGLSRNEENGYAYTIPANTINKDVTLSYTTTEYVTVTFDGGAVATLTGSTSAITRKDIADKLYASVNDFIKGARGTEATIPTQVAKTDCRLIKNTDGSQQWKIGEAADIIADSTLKAATPSQSFAADTTLYAYGVQMFRVTFTAGENGAIKAGVTATYMVDEGTEIAAIFAGTAKDYSEGTEKSVVVPATTPADGYQFKEWSPVTGTVTAATSITASFEQAWYDLHINDAAQMKNITGQNADGKISWSSDVSFKLNPKKNTRITKVSYTVAAGANGTTFAGKTDVELTAADGVYTIPASDIKGDVTITVVTENTVKVTIKAGTDANGSVGGTTVFVVAKGGALDTTGLTTTPDAGYQWDGKFYTNAACTAENTATAYNEDTTLYVKFVPATYTFTPGNGVQDITGVGDNRATHGTDITFKVPYNKDTGVISKVSYKIGDGSDVELTPRADGTYTIPGSAITGDVTVSTKTLAQVAGLDDAKMQISFIKRDSAQVVTEGDGAYMAIVDQNADMKIMLLTGTTDGSKFFRLDNGTQMYWSAKYSAYVCWVDKDATAANMAGKIQYVSGKTPITVAYDGDINFDSKVNSADAGIVNDALLNKRIVPTSALQLFEMDVTGNKAINADDVTWILQKTVGNSN